MVRRGVDRPGIGDWAVLASAVVISLVLLFSGAGFRHDMARTLSRTVFFPLRLVLSYGHFAPDARGEIARIRLQLAHRSVDRARLADVLRENARLRDLLGFAERHEWELVPARVIGRSAERFGEMLTLAPGGRGVPFRGQPVVSSDGLVGCVVDVSERECRTKTIRHGGLPVSGMLLESRCVGVLRWEPRRRLLRLERIPLQGDVRVGEQVVTSGYGGIFPKGIPIGEAVAVRDDSTNLVKEILVDPAADLDRIEEVFLLGELRRLEE
jgi:rod shape-determining protein MreC